MPILSPCQSNYTTLPLLPTSPLHYYAAPGSLCTTYLACSISQAPCHYPLPHGNPSWPGRMFHLTFAAVSCQLAADTQDTISCFGLMVGHLSPLWEQLQTLHLASSASPTLACLWAICHCLLHITHNMWLDCNTQVLAAFDSQKSASFCTAICTQFDMGTHNLL